MDVPPPKGSNGEQGPDGANSAKAFFTLTSAFALRATADRPSLCPFDRLRASIKGEGVASNPYGADGSIAEELGVCQWGKASAWVPEFLSA